MYVYRYTRVYISWASTDMGAYTLNNMPPAVHSWRRPQRRRTQRRVRARACLMISGKTKTKPPHISSLRSPAIASNASHRLYRDCNLNGRPPQSKHCKKCKPRKTKQTNKTYTMPICVRFCVKNVYLLRYGKGSARDDLVLQYSVQLIRKRCFHFRYCWQ